MEGTLAKELPDAPECTVEPIKEDEFIQPETDNKAKSENVEFINGKYIYTDPQSGHRYEWNDVENKWSSTPLNEPSDIPKNQTGDIDTQGNKSQNTPNVKNERDRKCSYTDSESGVTYNYSDKQGMWVVEESKDEDSDAEESDKESDRVTKQDMTVGTYGFDGESHTYTDPSDGTVYIWDREKNAWFPKVDDDFLAKYQMSYGFIDSSKPVEEEKPAAKEDDKKDSKGTLKRKETPQEPSWFEVDQEHNTKVYVSNLPSDIQEQEFIDVMQKCGLIMRDVDTGRMKVKLYTDPSSGQLKGDGLCTYIKIESVDLALKLLDGYNIRGHHMKVERAQFEMKGTYNPSLKPKKKRKKDKEKIKKMQERLFAWQPDKLRGERAKHERIVIIKNLFEPQLFDKEVSLLLEYQQDLREECLKCGDVRRVVIYDRHPEGVAQVTFKEPEEADACIKLLNGRWFGQRKITAETWDGKTKYKIIETEEETKKRLQKWEKFLETGENSKATSSDSTEKVGENSKATLSDSTEKVGENSKATSSDSTEKVGENAEGKEADDGNEIGAPIEDS